MKNVPTRKGTWRNVFAWMQIERCWFKKYCKWSFFFQSESFHGFGAKVIYRTKWRMFFRRQFSAQFKLRGLSSGLRHVITRPVRSESCTASAKLTCKRFPATLRVNILFEHLNWRFKWFLDTSPLRSDESPEIPHEKKNDTAFPSSPWNLMMSGMSSYADRRTEYTIVI